MPATELVRVSVQVLFSGRLYFGKLAILGGDPGLGKTQRVLNLAARLTILDKAHAARISSATL